MTSLLKKLFLFGIFLLFLPYLLPFFFFILLLMLLLGGSLFFRLKRDGMIDFSSQKERSEKFLHVLMTLCACVMTADGKAKKSELEIVKRFLRENNSPEQAQEALNFLRTQLENPPSDPERLAAQLAFGMQKRQRLALIHILLSIASADGDLCESEESVIRRIAGSMQLSIPEYESLLAMFGKQKDSLENAYRILEISPQATDGEVKKAYHKMVLKHHPDRYATLGEAAKNDATEKFRRIQTAYEQIKAQRGFS